MAIRPRWRRLGRMTSVAAATTASSFPTNDTAPDNFGGLWWNALGGSEAGWGLSIAHQDDVIFASWFTYNLDGKGWWLVM